MIRLLSWYITWCHLNFWIDFTQVILITVFITLFNCHSKSQTRGRSGLILFEAILSNLSCKRGLSFSASMSCYTLGPSHHHVKTLTSPTGVVDLSDCIIGLALCESVSQLSPVSLWLIKRDDALASSSVNRENSLPPQDGVRIKWIKCT